MNAEAALEYTCQNPDFLVITGSRLYGTARYDESGNCISDVDLRGWTLPPWEYLLSNPQREGFKERVIAAPPEGDHIVASLRHFLTNLLKQDAQSFELFFAPETHIRKMSPLAAELVKARNLFLTKGFYWRIAGYGNSEWRKARAVRMEIEEPPKSLDEILAWIRNTIKPDKANMDEVVYWLTSHMPRKEVSSLHGINGKRRDEYAKFGYCTSSACHSIRLLLQCRELMDTGHITFPRPEAKMLQDIKHGRMNIAEIEPIYEEARVKADEAFANSKLPEKAEQGKVWQWYEQVVKQFLRKDPRFYDGIHITTSDMLLPHGEKP